MSRTRLETGKKGEDIAARYLCDNGCLVLERNFRCPLGEMDIIAREGSTLVFAEVRSRQSDGFGRPLESVGPTKQKKLSQIALYYLQKNRLERCEARFDVLGIKIRPNGYEVEWIRDAFDLISC